MLGIVSLGSKHHDCSFNLSTVCYATLSSDQRAAGILFTWLNHFSILQASDAGDHLLL